MPAFCRVALVNPPFKGSFDGIPMGLLYLASALENAGHEVTVHDFGSTEIQMQEAATQVLSRSPHIVGITGTSPSHAEALKLAAEIRHLNRDVWIIKGGYHERGDRAIDAFCSMNGDNFIPVDAAVNAAVAESQMVQLAVDRASGLEWPQKTDGVLVWRTGSPRLGLNHPAPAECATHIIPARRYLADVTRYKYGGIFGNAVSTQVITYRGCPFRCHFCAIESSVLRHEWETIGEGHTEFETPRL